MDYGNNNEMLRWHGREYCLEDNTSIDVSNCMWNGGNQNEQDLFCMLNDKTTPVKDSGDVTYLISSNVNTSKGLEQLKDPSSQLTSRRMLQFDSEVSDFHFPQYNDEMSAFLRSKEREDSIEEHLSEMSQWDPGQADGTPGICTEALDQSSEGWIASFFNDSEMQLSSEDMNMSAVPDVQSDLPEFCNAEPKDETSLVQKHPACTRRSVSVKGKKSHMQTTPINISSSVVYPFAFVKPCGVQGDVTLKDINQRIHKLSSSRIGNADTASYPTSGFSGKPVVGKTKIRTEGGKGSITIMRTMG